MKSLPSARDAHQPSRLSFLSQFGQRLGQLRPSSRGAKAFFLAGLSMTILRIWSWRSWKTRPGFAAALALLDIRCFSFLIELGEIRPDIRCKGGMSGQAMESAPRPAGTDGQSLARMGARPRSGGSRAAGVHSRKAEFGDETDIGQAQPSRRPERTATASTPGRGPPGRSRRPQRRGRGCARESRVTQRQQVDLLSRARPGWHRGSLSMRDAS